jgi:hypothetical protein
MEGVVATHKSQVEEVKLPSAVGLGLSRFFITRYRFRELRWLKVFRLFVAVVLEMRRQFGLQEEWQDNTVFPIDDSSDIAGFRDEDIIQREVGMTDGRPVQPFLIRNQTRGYAEVV